MTNCPSFYIYIHKYIMQPLLDLVESIAKEIQELLRQGYRGLNGTINHHGENVHTVDELANKIIINHCYEFKLIHTLISEEMDQELVINPEGKYNLCVDPLDGSSNLDLNISVGSIFSFYEHDRMKVCSDQILAAYALYGPWLEIVYTAGEGTFLYNTGERLQIPQHGRSYSTNEGYRLSWPENVLAYVDKCQHEKHSARYVGSMVADVHRTLLKGGIFMYTTAKLRLLYECAPLSFIIEQAGGISYSVESCNKSHSNNSNTSNSNNSNNSNKSNRVLDHIIQNVHQRVPIYMGSPDNVNWIISDF